MNIARWFLVIAALTVSSILHGQSVEVASNNSLAIDCYNRSLQAVASGDARFADVEICVSAIENQALSENDFLATLVNRGLIYATLGQADRAAQDYQQALTISNDVPEVYLNLGNLEFMRENWNQAITYYDQAETLGLIQTHVLYLNRGMAYEHSSRLDEAEAEYMAALELVPDWQPAVAKLQRIEAARLEGPASSEVN
jgi:tetratricopeptide (TPR) repeat protein